jgi:hypothetical protein
MCGAADSDLIAKADRRSTARCYAGLPFGTVVVAAEQ